MSSLACRICLRTDVKTLDLPDQLKTFHDELCDFETVQHKRLKYCALCAHQMKKCYKFKGQCLRANGLLKLWIKHDNKDISKYHKELPSPSLQITDNSRSFLFECQHDEKTLHNTNVTSDCKRNLVLKLNRSALVPDNSSHPESSKLSLNSSVPDRPNPHLRPAVSLSSGLRHAVSLSSGLRPAVSLSSGLRPAVSLSSGLRPAVSLSSGLRPAVSLSSGLRPAVSLSSGLRPAIRPNIGLQPSFRPNCGLSPNFRPAVGVKSDLRPTLETELVKAKNGILTIDPNLLSVQSKPAIRSNLGPRPALIPNHGPRPNFGPNISLRPTILPNLNVKTALNPNSGLELSIELGPSGLKQPKQPDLTLDPDFDVSYETDPLSIVKDGNAMGIDTNTMGGIDNNMDIAESTADIGENESVEVIEEQEVYMDDNMTDIDDTSDIEIEQKKVHNNKCTFRSTTLEEEEMYDNHSMDSTIDNKEELINNDTDNNNIDSDEYTYEYLEQDIDLLDFVTKPKKDKPSKATSIRNKQAKETRKEPKVKILKIEDVTNKNFTKAEGINKSYTTEKTIVSVDHTYVSHSSQHDPPFKRKLFGLFDESPFVLADETVLTRELFSVIYDKLNVRELNKLAYILMEGDFRANLQANVESLYRKYNPEYDSVFHVEYLHTEEKKIEEFKRRALHPDYIGADYKCELCYQTYPGQGYLDFHKKTYHDPANPLVCSICSYRVPTRSSMIRHRLLSHQAHYTCKLCPLRTNRMNIMRSHFESHKGAQYRCPDCSKVCYHAESLAIHKREAHAPHVCTTCAQQYSTERGLRVHRETQHKDAPPAEPALAVPCAACDVTFDTREAYQRHCSIAHRAEYRVPRGIRMPKSRKVSDEQDSENRIKRDKMYRTCEICHEKVYIEKFRGALYKHFRDKHPGVPYHAKGMGAKDFLCDECGRAFFLRSKLLDHKHAGHRPHKCELCPARFYSQKRLRLHLMSRAHGEPTRYACEVCGKLYKTRAHLDTHMKIHIGDRCYKCDICGKGFILKGALTEHVRGVHYKQRRVKKPRKKAQEI